MPYNSKMQLSVISIIFISYINAVTSTCTFPSTLEGEWDTLSKGNITVNSTHIIGYDVYTYTSIIFECYVTDGTQYVIKSDSLVLIGNPVNAYTCMKFTYQSESKFIYFLMTAELADANYERVQFVSANRTDVTLSEICDTSSVSDTIQETKIFIKKDMASSAATLCATHLLGEFWYQNGTSCTSSSWDACNPNTEMTFNYTMCSDTQAFSQNGSVYCVHTTSSGNLQINYVYNRDDTTDESTYYRFSCMAAEYDSSTGYVVVTTKPEDCYKNQTSTYVPSGGTTMTLSANVTCGKSNCSTQSTINQIPNCVRVVPQSSSDEAATATIAAVIVVVLILIIVGIGVGYYVYMKKFKKVDPQGKVIDKEKSGISSTDVDRSKDTVTPSVVMTEVATPRNGASHESDPRLREPNPIQLQDFLHHKS